MKSMSKVFMLGAAAALVGIALAGCGSTDVVAKVANTSFAAVVQASGGRVTWSAEKGVWTLTSTSGDEVRFASDFAREPVAGSATDTAKPDVEFAIAAAPFVAAGLVVEKLPSADGLSYSLEDGKLVIRFELGAEKFTPEASKSLDAVFAEIVRTLRSRIGYHEKLDHYGIKLGNGNMFEWAKDMAKNDKDIVWVLNPEPFIAAGADPAKIEGWVFAKVETKDEGGKIVFVDKLLKPFDLK